MDFWTPPRFLKISMESQLKSQRFQIASGLDLKSLGPFALTSWDAQIVKSQSQRSETPRIESRDWNRNPNRLSKSVENWHCSGTPTNPYNLSEKCWQYTSNLYRNTPPICNAVPCWLLSLKDRETPQYTSYFGGCPNDPWPEYFCKSIAIQVGSVSWYKLVLHVLLAAKRRAYFCKSIAIEMGGVWRYFSKVSGSGLDSWYLYRSTPPICTAVCLTFVPAILLGKYQWLGVAETS